MRKLKEILRLKYGAKLSHRQIAASLTISPSSVSTYANRAGQLGIVDWPLDAKWDDVTLKQAFFNTQVQRLCASVLAEHQAVIDQQSDDLATALGGICRSEPARTLQL